MVSAGREVVRDCAWELHGTASVYRSCMCNVGFPCQPGMSGQAARADRGAGSRRARREVGRVERQRDSSGTGRDRGARALPFVTISCYRNYNLILPLRPVISPRARGASGRRLAVPPAPRGPCDAGHAARSRRVWGRERARAPVVASGSPSRALDRAGRRSR